MVTRNNKIRTQWEYDMKHDFGITREEYMSMYSHQHGCCAICGGQEPIVDSKTGKQRNLAIDHDHVTGKIRGLLCSRCNLVLGKVRDDVNLLATMIGYLHDHDSDHSLACQNRDVELSVSEVAERLNISVYKAISIVRDHIPFKIKNNGAMVIMAEDLEAYLAYEADHFTEYEVASMCSMSVKAARKFIKTKLSYNLSWSGKMLVKKEIFQHYLGNSIA